MINNNIASMASGAIATGAVIVTGISGALVYPKRGKERELPESILYSKERPRVCSSPTPRDYSGAKNDHACAALELLL